nr:platelet glycoprotein Ib alpha chain-like [Ipomoea batatas]
MIQKRFADEKRSAAFGRGTILDRVRKPVADVENNETIGGKEKESDGVEVQVLVGDKAAMSDVEKISTKTKILAAAIVKFGKAMAEVGSKNTGKDIIKKTFSKMSDMSNVTSTSQPAETLTLLDDDPILNDESFLAAVSALEKAFIVTTNPVEHPKEAELDGLPSSPSWNLLTPTPPPRIFKSQMKQPLHALLNTMHLPISKRLKRAQQQ